MPPSIKWLFSFLNLMDLRPLEVKDGVGNHAGDETDIFLEDEGFGPG